MLNDVIELGVDLFEGLVKNLGPLQCEKKGEEKLKMDKLATGWLVGCVVEVVDSISKG